MGLITGALLGYIMIGDSIEFTKEIIEPNCFLVAIIGFTLVWVWSGRQAPVADETNNLPLFVFFAGLRII